MEIAPQIQNHFTAGTAFAEKADTTNTANEATVTNSIDPILWRKVLPTAASTSPLAAESSDTPRRLRDRESFTAITNRKNTIMPLTGVIKVVKIA